MSEMSLLDLPTISRESLTQLRSLYMLRTEIMTILKLEAVYGSTGNRDLMDQFDITTMKIRSIIVQELSGRGYPITHYFIEASTGRITPKPKPTGVGGRFKKLSEL